jgi:hypothetical protein
MAELPPESSPRSDAANTATKTPDALTVVSLLNVLLMTVHLSGDIVYGYEPGGLNNLSGMLIVVILLYATLVLRGRRSGYLIVLFGSLLAVAVPVVHMSGSAGIGARIEDMSDRFFFTWTSMALGAGGAFASLLSMSALWRLRGSIVGFLLWTVTVAVALGGVVYAFAYFAG